MSPGAMLSLAFNKRGNNLEQRSRDGRLLAFKKGAFRFAMDAGFPILPITIRNSRQILPSDSLDLSPGEG